MEAMAQVLRATPASRAQLADSLPNIANRAGLDRIETTVALQHLMACGWVRRIDVPHATYWTRTFEADQLRWL